MIILLKERIVSEPFVRWIGLQTGGSELIGDISLPRLMIILVEVSMTNPVNEKDFYLGRIAKARSRAFRAALTAFWKTCSAAFSWVELFEVV
jgi:hypothetical protein